MAFKRVLETIVTTENERITIRDLQQIFDIKKTNTTSQNELYLEIYNLNEDTQKIIKKQDNEIVINAGYEDEGSFNLFFGTITQSETVKDGNNRITKIYAYDASNKLRQSNISIGYDAGTKTRQVYDTISRKLGLPIVNPNNIIDKELVNGYSFVGKTKDALEELLKFTKQKYTIQDNQIFIYTGNEIFSDRIILLSKKTGLIGKPELITENEGETKDDGKQRLRLQALILSPFSVGSQLQLESENFNGIYVIERTNIKGDYRGNDWTSIVEVVEA